MYAIRPSSMVNFFNLRAKDELDEVVSVATVVVVSGFIMSQFTFPFANLTAFTCGFSRMIWFISIPLSPNRLIILTAMSISFAETRVSFSKSPIPVRDNCCNSIEAFGK